MDRREEKFIIPNFWYGGVAKGLEKDYNILEISGERLFRYDNLYFDTPENKCLEDHIRGRKKRFKIRIRSYVSSKISFLEVKKRNVHGRSIKDRMLRTTEKWDSPLTDEEKQFISVRVPFADSLIPVLYSSYYRLTLSNLDRGERLTFDTKLKFATLDGKRCEMLKDLSVVELKQDKKDRRSPIYKIFRKRDDRRAPIGRPISVSKYVIGHLHLNNNLSARTYSECLRDLQRASNIVKLLSNEYLDI